MNEFAPLFNKKPNILQEQKELASRSHSAEKTYIEDRLSQIGSDLMNTRYERDAEIDEIITFLKGRQEELEGGN